MRARIDRLVCFGAVGLGLLAPSAEAQLSSAEMFVNVHAGVSAVDMDVPQSNDSFQDGPRTLDILLDSGSIPWDVQAAAGGGAATSDGLLRYLATTTSQIYSHGDFSMLSSAEFPAAALAGFDAVMSISFQVATQTTFTITGFVSTGRALDDPEVVNCQYNGVVLAGDTRATPLAAGTYVFQEEHTLYPLETGVLGCSAASSGGMSDSNALTWDVAVNDLPEPGTAAGTLAAVAALGALARSRAWTRTAC